MPEELRELLKEWHTVPVATSGPDGKPNVAGKSVMVTDPETIVWGELYFGQSCEISNGIPGHPSVSGNGPSRPGRIR